MYELDEIVTSYLIGEGIRATEDGHFIQNFSALDDIFNQEPGVILGIADKLLENLQQCALVNNAKTDTLQIYITFDKKFCPYI